ncbi:MAG TPA: 2-oxoacid:acceptor oxidoreductase family protein, partial [Chloroflexota bacterium]
MYRIRFHGRGGQGIKTSSRMLGSAFFFEGFEVQDAPVYGAERRGAPIFAHVRASHATIHERGAINHPDLVVVVDETLIPLPTANVLLGITSNTVLFINSGVPAEEWRRRLNLDCPIVTLPLASDVVGRADLPYMGAMCAGAAARLIGEIGPASLARAIQTELNGAGQAVVDRNLQDALGAYAAVEPHAALVIEGLPIAARDYARPGWVDLTVESGTISAPDVHGTGTSVQIKTAAWRTMRPVIDYDRCNRCTWVCSTLCPDSTISVAEDGRPQIDYDHCKGCLVCVAVCPPHAISAVPETSSSPQPPIAVRGP